jgi:hypothetical protein
MSVEGNPPDDEFEARLERTLRDRGQQVPQDVAERLALMRREALLEIPEKTKFLSWLSNWQLVLPVGAAGAALVVVLFVPGLFSGEEEILQIPLTLGNETVVFQEIEILEELEFLAWLEEEDEGAG